METETNWKYIVYCTTNIKNNFIYIGVHKTWNPEVFDGYLGCGCISTQPYTYSHPKTAFLIAVKQFGPSNFIRTTLKVFDNEADAYDLEAQLVNTEFLARSDVYNMILGGNKGISETNKVKVYQYDKTGKFVREYNSLIDAAIAVNRDYSAITNAINKKGTCAGYYWNTDKIKLLDLTDYKKGDPQAKQVYLYSVAGQYLNTFPTFTKCAEFIHVGVCEITQGVAGGYLIRGQYYVCLTFDTTYDKARKKYIQNREVFRYNLDGTYNKSYKTQREAEMDNPNSNINRAIKNKKPCKNNYLWGLVKLEEYNKPLSGSKFKKMVYKYDINYNLIATYPSKTLTAKVNGNGVWDVFDKPNHTYKKHIYTTKPIKEIVSAVL